MSKTPCASVLSVSVFWPSYCSRRLTGRITASQLEWINNVLRPWWQVWGQIFCPHTCHHHRNPDKQGVSSELWGCEGRKRKKVFFILSACNRINFRANESWAKLVWAMPSAAENHEINRIGNMPKFSINERNEKIFSNCRMQKTYLIVNKQVNF